MDGYAPAYVAHNIPLLVVSGLGFVPPDESTLNDVGTHITSDVPIVDSADSEALLRHFRDGDARGLAWNSREYTGRNKFRVKTVGRDYVLPPRSAISSAQRLPNSQGSSPATRTVLHSPLSPLTPGSTVFPDGLVDSKWVEKHQELVPSAYLSFYKFTSDPTVSTLRDNQLKSDINNTKSILGQSGYKTRLVVGLLSEESIVQSPEVEDRLANIRKATGLDSKTSLFFLPPKSSPVELQAFVETIISTIYPLCIEYYRDLSKHSRRKRNRGIVPPPTAPPTSGTSQTLSSQGWNVRYDFKLGVLAEFRQEMDAAIRSYESGYDILLSSDVLEAIASWSPRWNEARLLADVFAIRILRCLFWNGNTTAATRRWQQHRDRIRDFVDRRGKGSSTYGWKAWEARWATVMAETIKKVSIIEFTGSTIFLLTEKAIAMGERMEPWEYLHHPGYWYRLAAQHLMARRNLALEIPDEDRSPPGVSPASQIASKAYTYDTYLCPEPHEENPLPGRDGVDHSLLIIHSLTKAINEFEQRKQSRLAQDLSLLSAKESLRREAWDDALRVLRPLWQKMSFRREGWWNAVEEVGWALREAAVHAGDGGTVLAVDWELLNQSFSHHPRWHYDLSMSLNDLKSTGNKPVVVLHDQDVHSFLSATYTFEHHEGKVGELCPSQLAVTSVALPTSVPITMTEIRIEFEGSMKPIILRHDSSAQDPSPELLTLRKVSLDETQEQSSGRDGRPAMSGETCLTFRAGRIRVFQFGSLLREAGEARAISATFVIASDFFDLEYVQTFSERTSTPDIWWGENSSKRKLVRNNAFAITILPKPPKMEFHFLELQEHYYTNEEVKLQLEVVNGEDADSITDLEVHLLGESAPLLTLRMAGSSNKPDNSDEGNSHSKFALGNIAAAASCIVELLIPPIDLPAVYELTMKTSYNLVSDLETPVSRSMSTQLTIINPFEANYDFSPRIHPDPWPSFFTHDEKDDKPEEIDPRGLSQKWRLTSRYFSFAAEDLIVEDLNVEVLGTNGGIHCYAKKAFSIPEAGIRVRPKSLEEAEFDVFTQKISLDDRGTATLDVSLAIRWRRDEEGSTINTTILGIPRLLVSSSEPRVLGAVSYSGTVPSMLHFDVTIENPSNHFLTFGVSMEPSEKFAFSGVKQSTLQLVPLSRRTMRFRLLPFSRGDWIGPIRCVIRDKYFQKVLKIAPTEGMRLDKDSIYIWVPPEGESEDS
ncbi:Trafficking particle complex subunit 11 [Hyphodiscus hymeniophilus]|uniref:Trafficking particle complex subunit 11 n=1 Tax=Hyphodiscus hymeniophilus TaxID=353542 RepID=A0A9P6VLI1_9HELO|nr:Trafficking particle complex subunit 11 [Hyphodiscus hymeniophilus]